YGALCEIASLAGSQRFTALHSTIADKAGTSRATVQRRLPALAKLGLIKMKGSGFRVPLIFCLLEVHVASRCNNDVASLTLPHGEALIKNVQYKELEEDALFELKKFSISNRKSGRTGSLYKGALSDLRQSVLAYSQDKLSRHPQLWREIQSAKTRMAQTFWRLLNVDPQTLAETVGDAVTKKRPAAWLNTVLAEKFSTNNHL